MRIPCNILPPKFNELEKFTSSNIYTPIIQNKIPTQ
ncbi:unnamed protein product, partial [Rotaria sordida]